jgi:hypothetical protein
MIFVCFEKPKPFVYGAIKKIDKPHKELQLWYIDQK